ncbi:MAG: pyrimidine 5'-nucleotidase [Leptothrix ochracea]|uniref:pyrimidine 5'-nucleotidase n=1 Tax=Leptothrix ochracea TaxID=735331 RepID=UPI0034E2C283
MPNRSLVWLFDLDDTLHNASHAAFGGINRAMTDFIVRELGVDERQAQHLRTHYWQRYGATLLGLMRHHGVRAQAFLEETHRLPGLERRLHSHPHDVAALRRLPGRKVIVTNAPAHYAERVLRVLGLRHHFEAVISIEQMRMFGHLRPKPDARMLRALVARLGVKAGQCVLVEDTLAHQKAARRVGMRTVWMQRWLTQAAASSPQISARMRRKPAYVCDKIRTFQRLLALI